MSDVRDLEYSTLKAPYEVFNKQFRNAQKSIDREVQCVTSACKELTQSVHTNDSQQVSSAISTVLEKLKSLKRKATESLETEREQAQACKVRLQHLSQRGAAPQPPEEWQRVRLNRMLAEYFLRRGYTSTAGMLINTEKIQHLTNMPLFLGAKKIEDSLRAAKTGLVLSWCYDNKSKLKKLNSCIEFRVRQQDFIELIKTHKRLEAVNYARKHLSGVEDAALLTEVQEVMGLLAFKVDTKVKPYQSLLSDKRWCELAEMFRAENLRLHQLHEHSPFVAVLQTGLSALKTPECGKEGENKADCPACSPEFSTLVSHLPYAHCTRSRLACFVNARPLNEHNTPMVLPSHHVYGLEALEAMMEADGYITCPRSGERCDISEAEKVFIM